MRCGPYELDVTSRELVIEGRRVRLQDQPFEILHAMLERPGEVITRDALRRRLWPDGTFVDFEHSLNAAIKRLRAALGDDADNPRFVETLPRRGYRFIAAAGEPARDDASPAGGGVRLAILPFANLSGDLSEEYFSDGLTDEMIAQAGRLCRGRVAVIARSSCMALKGATMRAREMGETLRANYLVEGSVRRDGDRVRITARLIAADAETQLWADTYDRALSEYCDTAAGRLSVQADVALRVARALALELAPGTHTRILRTTPPAAYQSLLKGRYFWNMTADEGLDQAVAWFEQALREAPSCAPAMAALARAHIGRAEYYRDRPRVALDAAQQSAKRALALEPDLSEAYVALGDANRMLGWDWPAAEAAYLAAQARNPSYVGAYRGYAKLLAERGRHEEATRAFEQAFELDPLCLDAGVCAGWARFVAGDYDAAIDYCRNTLDMAGGLVAAWRVLGAAYLQAGRRDEAIDALRHAVRISGGHPVPQLALAHGLAATGATQEARQLLATARSSGYAPPYHRAVVHAALGECDAAVDALHEACADRDPALTDLGVDPRLTRLRADPRVIRLMEEMGIA